MEAASWFSWMSLVYLVVGVAAGSAAGHFLSPAIGEAKRLRDELSRLQNDHDSYRASVNSHFRKTADLVGEMTKSYAAVYDHLAGGARRFCSDSDADAAIPFGPLPGALASPAIETATGETLAEAVEDAFPDEAAIAEEDAMAERPAAEEAYAGEEAPADGESVFNEYAGDDEYVVANAEDGVEGDETEAEDYRNRA